MSEVNKLDIANRQLYYTNNSVGQNKVAEAQDSVKQDFNFDEINKLFTEGGVKAALNKLKELNTAGKIGNLQIQEDKAGNRTIISFNFNSTSFKLTGAIGDFI